MPKIDYKDGNFAKLIIKHASEKSDSVTNGFKELAENLKIYHSRNPRYNRFTDAFKKARDKLETQFSGVDNKLVNTMSPELSKILRDSGLEVQGSEVNARKAPAVSIGQYAQAPQSPQYLKGPILPLPLQQQQQQAFVGVYRSTTQPSEEYAVPNTYASTGLAAREARFQQLPAAQVSSPGVNVTTPTPAGPVMGQPQLQATTPTPNFQRLFDVVRNGDSNALGEMIKSNPSLVNSMRDNDGYTPLHWAPNKQIAEMLVTAGADVNAKGNDGSTPAYWAQNKPELKSYLDGLVQPKAVESGGIYSSAALAGRQSNIENQQQIYTVPENLTSQPPAPATNPEQQGHYGPASSAVGTSKPDFELHPSKKAGSAYESTRASDPFARFAEGANVGRGGYAQTPPSDEQHELKLQQNRAEQAQAAKQSQALSGRALDNNVSSTAKALAKVLTQKPNAPQGQHQNTQAARTEVTPTQYGHAGQLMNQGPQKPDVGPATKSLNNRAPGTGKGKQF